MAATLSVNGKREEIEAGVTLEAILESKRIRPTVAVVLLNRARITKDSLAEKIVTDGDSVEIVIQLAGGSHA
jgi:thiamine biosynthesis protein ThiS